MRNLRVKAGEVVAWGLGLIILGAVMGYGVAFLRFRPFIFLWGQDELKLLAAKYGPHTYSENGEEWILRDYFGEKRGGVFLDVGANHYQHFNNTYYLEMVLAWSGVAIEPQTKFAPDYAKHRPRTRFIPLFVSDVADQKVNLYIPRNDMQASSTQEMAAAHGGALNVVATKTTSLDDVLLRTGVEHIDFFSLDVELAEPKALAGFSIDRYKPTLACVESHLDTRQAVLDYFTAHRYRLLGRYLRADERNLWFERMPLDLSHGQ